MRLSIDTQTIPVYKTKLNLKELESIRKRMHSLFEKSVENQYNSIYDCLLEMKNNFENDSDDLAIQTMMQTMTEGYFNGKKVSQPSHFQNLILHIIDRATPMRF